MGRIKTKLIKRYSAELVRVHSDRLKTTFDENKLLVEEFLEVKSKKLRNIIAGSITKTMKQRD